MLGLELQIRLTKAYFLLTIYTYVCIDQISVSILDDLLLTGFIHELATNLLGFSDECYSLLS